MKAARIVVLGIALVAGVGAAMLAGGSDDHAPAPQTASGPIKTVEILVAGKDIEMGSAVRAGDLRWQAWPEEAANDRFLSRAKAPTALEDSADSIARQPFVAGEPIRPEKLIKGSGSGYMAAILPAGMRAISIEISPETGAGGFILPNDRVDVILTREQARANGAADAYSETISPNVRVLAVDQTVTEQDGQKVVVGKTATLELSPAQAEQIAQSRRLGTITLALRSLADSNPNQIDSQPDEAKRGVTIVRFGVASQGGGR